MTGQNDTLSECPDHRINTAKTAVVTPNVTWTRIDANTPLGVKMLLINEFANSTSVGVITGRDTWWTHWAPLPVWSK
jgi:hypothetical protein